MQSDLFDYSNAFFVVKGTITVTGAKNIDSKDWYLALKSIISCIYKIDNAFTDNAEDLDVVMPMYNLTEYSKLIIEKQQVVYRIITEMNLVIFVLIIMMQTL